MGWASPPVIDQTHSPGPFTTQPITATLIGSVISSASFRRTSVTSLNRSTLLRPQAGQAARSRGPACTGRTICVIAAAGLDFWEPGATGDLLCDFQEVIVGLTRGSHVGAERTVGGFQEKHRFARFVGERHQAAVVF